MNVCECLTNNAKIFPNKTAIIFDGKEISYSRLNQLSKQAAIILSKHGVRPGDRVALMLPNAPSFPIWYYAVLRTGGVAVSVSTRLATAEVNFVATDCQAKVFVGSIESCSAVKHELPGEVEVRLCVQDSDGSPMEPYSWNAKEDGDNGFYHASPDEPALILYTSGTTGFPKGATLSHNNVRSNVHAFNHLCNMQKHDVVLLAVPLFHCFGQNALLNSVLNVGGTIVLQPRFDLNESKILITENRVSQLYGVPMMFGLWLESCSPNDLSSVNYCFSAAATLPIQTGDAWQRKFNLPIHEGYGLTETSPFATYNHREHFMPGSIGTPIDCVEVRILDTETGEECPVGGLGEIAIRGPNVMLGYWNRPEDTAAAIRDGWFRSGDIGRLDENGYLFIVDRVKDMITVGGLKVFPAEVERVILDHPAVSEAAIVGAPDAVFGEQVVGYIVLHEGNDQTQTMGELEQLTKSNLGNYKVPRRLFVIDEMPRNPSGKILKTELRDTAAKQIDPVESPAQLQNTALNLAPASLENRLVQTHASERLDVAIRFLQEQVRETLELDETPQPDSSFIDAGLDSLAMVELSAQVQIEVGNRRELPPTLLFDHPRISDLAKFLLDCLSNDGQRMSDSNDRNMTLLPKPASKNTKSKSPTELRRGN